MQLTGMVVGPAGAELVGLVEVDLEVLPVTDLELPGVVVAEGLVEVVLPQAPVGAVTVTVFVLGERIQKQAFEAAFAFRPLMGELVF